MHVEAQVLAGLVLHHEGVLPCELRPARTAATAATARTSIIQQHLRYHHNPG